LRSYYGQDFKFHHLRLPNRPHPRAGAGAADKPVLFGFEIVSTNPAAIRHSAPAAKNLIVSPSISVCDACTRMVDFNRQIRSNGRNTKE
jgi:hypothetical protein